MTSQYGRGEPVARGGATAPIAPARRIGFLAASAGIAFLMAVAAWVTILGNDHFPSRDFFSLEPVSRAADFAGDLVGAESSATPAFYKPAEWAEKARLAGETLAMSVAAAGLAALGALALFMFGARNVMMGSLAPYQSPFWTAPFFLVRGLFTVSRAIPELVWAMILVFVFTQGTLPGVIALAIHNGGILGKLGSEIVEGLDTRPMRALRSTGAGRMQVLLYGVLPGGSAQVHHLPVLPLGGDHPNHHSGWICRGWRPGDRVPPGYEPLQIHRGHADSLLVSGPGAFRGYSLRAIAPVGQLSVRHASDGFISR